LFEGSDVRECAAHRRIGSTGNWDWREIDAFARPRAQAAALGEVVGVSCCCS